MLNYGWILITIAAAMWGIDGVLLTPRYFIYGFFDVRLIVFVSHFVPLLILSVIYFKEYRRIKEFNKEDIAFYILIALFGGCIGTFSIVKALQLSNFSLSMVTLIQKAQPIFAVILAYVLLKERPSKRFYVVLIITIISLYLLIFELQKPSLLPENNLRAAMYSLIAAMSFGSSTVFGKKVVNKYSFKTTTFYRFFFTSIIALIFLLLNPVSSKISFAKYFSDYRLYSLTLVIAVYSLTAISTYYMGMISTKASYATICELAYPLCSVLVEALVLKHYLRPIQLIAATILVVSIVYLNLKKEQ